MDQGDHHGAQLGMHVARAFYVQMFRSGHVARAGWWERMCAALAVDGWERSRLRAGEASLPPRGDG